MRHVPRVGVSVPLFFVFVGDRDLVYLLRLGVFDRLGFFTSKDQ